MVSGHHTQTAALEDFRHKGLITDRRTDVAFVRLPTRQRQLWIPEFVIRNKAQKMGDDVQSGSLLVISLRENGGAKIDHSAAG